MIDILQSVLRFLIILVLFSTSCQKSDSYKRLAKIANDKYLEIKALSESRSCSNLDEWQMKTIYYSCWHHFAIHEDDLEEFEKLATEYVEAQKRADSAKDKPAIFFYSPCEPSPPVLMLCEAGRPKLVHAYEIEDLSIVETQLESRYEEIMDFYADVPCTNPEDWSGQAIRIGCCYEGIAVHRTLKTYEFIELIYIYGNLNAQKRLLTGATCNYDDCKYTFKPVQCRDGKPYVEMTD